LNDATKVFVIILSGSFDFVQPESMQASDAEIPGNQKVVFSAAICGWFSSEMLWLSYNSCGDVGCNVSTLRGFQWSGIHT
jgi:hypothetical protein